MKSRKVQIIEKKRTALVVRELNKLYPGTLKTPLNYESDIDLLVAVMLSAQSTDKGVNKLTSSLFKKFRTADDYAEASIKTLEKELSSINYYRTKARHIRETMCIISKLHNGSVPNSMDALLKLPGVGRKTANVILGHLFKTYEGIAVDTHVIRLSRKFGLSKSLDAARIERELMFLVPKNHWWSFSYKMKAYGREISSARRGLDDPITQKLIKQKLIKTQGIPTKR
jgi:endonuclease III